MILDILEKNIIFYLRFKVLRYGNKIKNSFFICISHDLIVPLHLNTLWGNHKEQ